MKQKSRKATKKAGSNKPPAHVEVVAMPSLTNSISI